MTDHSKLPPSSAARRMACPGSRAMEERYGRNEESEASKEGQLAHELAALYAKAYNQGGIEFVDYKDGEYTDEMDDCAREYGRIIDTFIDEEDLHIEERVDISCIHPECWGTPDAWGIVGNDIHVFDYKFGFTPVDAYENWQLLEYACGIYEANKTLTSIALQNFNIYLHIVQPRDFSSGNKHKMWHLTGHEFESYRQRLVISEALAMNDNAALKISEECKYCKARYACPALKKAAFGASEVALRGTPHGDDFNIGAELKFLHEAQDLLSYRITALETEAGHRIKSGINVDNYELTPTMGRMTWAIDTTEILNLGEVFRVNLNKEEFVTPTQAIKLGITEEIVLKYSERKTGLKLTRTNLTKSKEVFKK